MNPYNAYAAADTNTDADTKPKLLVKVFQALLDKIDIVEAAIENRNYEMKYKELSKITTVLEVLNGSLDMDQGEIPSNLSSIYQYLIKELSSVHVSCDVNRVNECRAILNNISEGFQKAYEIETKNKTELNFIEDNRISSSHI